MTGLAPANGPSVDPAVAALIQMFGQGDAPAVEIKYPQRRPGDRHVAGERPPLVTAHPLPVRPRLPEGRPLMEAFDPIPDRHPRLVAWANAMRAADWTLREIAHLFGIERAELIEAGVQP